MCLFLIQWFLSSFTVPSTWCVIKHSSIIPQNLRLMVLLSIIAIFVPFSSTFLLISIIIFQYFMTKSEKASLAYYGTEPCIWNYAKFSRSRHLDFLKRKFSFLWKCDCQWTEIWEWECENFGTPICSQIDPNCSFSRMEQLLIFCTF